MENTSFGYNSIYDLAGKEKEKELLHVHTNKQSKYTKKAEANKRKAKQLSKTMAPVSQQQGVMKGHTGYLTFAIKF